MSDVQIGGERAPVEPSSHSAFLGTERFRSRRKPAQLVDQLLNAGDDLFVSHSESDIRFVNPSQQTKHQWYLTACKLHHQDMTDGGSSADDVADRLRLLREWAGYENQSAFAERTGLTPPEWNHYETGRRPLTLKAANLIKTRWRVTLDWLYHGERDGLSVQVANSLPSFSEWRQKRAG